MFKGGAIKAFIRVLFSSKPSQKKAYYLRSQFTRQSNPDVNSYIKQVRSEVNTILTGETTNEVFLERPPFTL
jgi:hypothetical protein